MANLRRRFGAIAMAVCVLTLVALASQQIRAQQQSPTPTPGAAVDPLLDIRQLIAGGFWNEAWESLAKAPRSAAVFDLRVQVALELDRPSDALAAWDLLRTSGGDAQAALQRIALYTTRKLAESSDDLVRLESERLLATMGDQDARTRLVRRMDSPASTPLERAGAAAALASLGDIAAASRFAVLTQSVPTRDQFNLIRLTLGLPDQVALKILTPMLKSSASDVRYAAVLALGERRTPDITRALRDFLATSPEGAARLAAMLALAYHGDRAMLGELGKIASHFGDREILGYARALLAIGDSQGTRLLAVVQNGDDEMLRLEAAAIVAQSSPATGRDYLVGALGNPNVWIRLRALELLRDTRPEPNAFAHLLLAPQDWIRLRSAELALGLQAPGARGGARP